ncbi:tyrosine-protein phosphatase [Evansella sp. AB-rgal1]|uniref:tyrosine-protein phosphatase n=1 Tax=Evansella sp. AB-rgal1 TaxID=3242696 RepID=UPI00359E15F3
MIDIHCHIVPEVDDGPKSIEESMALARLAVSESIHTIIATPHHNSTYTNERSTIIPAVESLNEALRKEGIDLTIVPGQEPRIFGEIIEAIQHGEILTLNDKNKYFFIELPFDQVPRYTEKLIYNAQLQGVAPIIVHPERNAELLERPELLYRLVKNGAITQVTTSSITGHFGKKIKKFTEEMIEADLAHLVASDAHNTSSRAFRMEESFSIIEKKYGLSLITQWRENAALVLEGKHVYMEPPKRIKQKKWLGLF